MKKCKGNNIRLKYVSKTVFVFVLFFFIIVTIGALTNSLLFSLIPNYNINPLTVILICAASTCLVGCITSYFSSNSIIKVTSKIDIILKKAMDGDFDSQIELPKKKTIISDTLANFNKMLKELGSNQLLKEDFVSNFSHEFKTPIVSIKGYAELLKEERDLSEEEKNKYLDIIINESKRLVDLSNQTMLICNLDNNEIITNRETFSLKEQIEECTLLLDNLLKLKNLSVNLKLDNVKYNTNKNMLKELWLNIITNAIKYSKNDGVIDISSSIEGNLIIISIRDHGIGMEEEELKYIFDRFYQVDKSHNSKGIGLGLTIAKRIVALNNGKIEVSSVKDKGTVFNIILEKNI